MIHEGWAAFGDTEVWNNARTYAYMNAGLRPCRLSMRCPSHLLPAMLGDPPYIDPVSDGAAWVDPLYPESAEFAGLWVESVTGFDGSNVSRVVTDAVRDGGVLSRLRYRPREIVVTGWLIGKTCCSVSYGLRWLASVLAKPRACATSCGTCGGDTLCVFRCQPRPEEVGLAVCVNEPITDPLVIAAVEAASDRFLRQVHSVGLVEGPVVLEQRGMGCGCCGCTGIVKVEFRLVAANPWLWTTPQVCLAPSAFNLNFDPSVCAVNWVPAEYCEPCGDVSSCVADPECPQPPAPPEPPVVPTNCACTPLVTSRQCCTAQTGDWFDATAVIDIYGGSTGVHNMIIRGFLNPAGLPADQFRDCDACLGIAVSWVPPFSTLTIDGVHRRITLNCPGGVCEPGDAAVFDAGGRPFSWVDFECQPLLICADADAFRTATDATVAISVVGREPV